MKQNSNEEGQLLDREFGVRYAHAKFHQNRFINKGVTALQNSNNFKMSVISNCLITGIFLDSDETKNAKESLYPGRILYGKTMN